jgi:hypothetical protein
MYYQVSGLFPIGVYATQKDTHSKSEKVLYAAAIP